MLRAPLKSLITRWIFDALILARGPPWATGFFLEARYVSRADWRTSLRSQKYIVE